MCWRSRARSVVDARRTRRHVRISALRDLRHVEVLAIDGDGARLRLKFQTNRRISDVHDAADVPFVRTRTNLLRLADEGILSTATATAHGAHRRARRLVALRHQLAAQAGGVRTGKQRVARRLGRKTTRAHHLRRETTANLRALVTTVRDAVSGANTHDTAVLLHVTRANPKSPLVNVFNRARGVLVFPIYDANHRSLIDRVHVRVLRRNVTT